MAPYPRTRTLRRLRRIVVIAISLAIAALLGAVAVAPEPARNTAGFLLARARGGYTVAERLDQYGPGVERRLRGEFEQVGLTWPPRELAFLAFKDERALQVHGRDKPGQPWRFVRDYPILAASGTAGPKLAEGDRQVPEGIYRVESLNPNSRFHLSPSPFRYHCQADSPG